MKTELKKGIKLSQFIKVLTKLHAEHGDLEVWLAGDEEGNNFSPFVYQDYSTGIENGKLVLYPLYQYMAEEVF